jgi:ribonuclease P protein component
MSAYPVKLVHLTYAKETADVKAMFVVPKKKFKRANERNTLKRRMREAYRLQKSEFYKAVGNTGLNLAFIYYGNKEEEYQVIAKALSKLLNNLTREITGAVKQQTK